MERGARLDEIGQIGLKPALCTPLGKVGYFQKA